MVSFSDDHDELSGNVFVDNSSAVVGDSQHLTDSVSCISASGADDFFFGYGSRCKCNIW